jgi:hypothetical protein
MDFASGEAIVGQMIRKFIRAVGLKIAQTIGMPIKDFRSGRSLGRALVVPWRGKIHVIGLDVAVRHVAARPMFQPQKRLTYWKQEIVFTEHPSPDFPNIRKRERPSPTKITDG